MRLSYRTGRSLRESDSKRSRRTILQAWLSAYTTPYVINQRANHPRLNRLCVTKTTKGDCRRVRRGGSGVRGFAVVTGVKCSHGGVLWPTEKRGRPTPVYEVLFSDTGSLTGQYVTRLSLREPSDIRLYLLSCIILYWSWRCWSICGVARVSRRESTRRIILTIRGNSKL